MEYGQFCPVAKAMEIIGERWTMLIVREMLSGATRFSELQRGLCLISPTVLTKRLADLSEAGVILRKKIPGQRGYEYFLTEMGQGLMPVVKQVGDWGMRWARGNISDTDLDLELLMLYLQRSVDTEKLVGNETVVRFKFTDLEKYSDWWLVARKKDVDVCYQDPGKEVDVYFTVDLRTMTELWMGDTTYRKAAAAGRLKLVGPVALTRNVSSWLVPSIFAGIPPAGEI
ncbi:MAG: winged helix-turn-helix transcriptional regulator [Gammaproteobacteria bacterium]|jgi:DNA-binding HxlR family transcriptional regulator|nr:winged helix-turn-helix transcriptional regulator [Gammaproteobacteria bacterium]